jgi:ATP-dependent DNA helicase RecG
LPVFFPTTTWVYEITTPEQIDIWRNLPTENQKLEFKEAKTQFDNEKLFQYCVALANEGGGHLLLGISNAFPRQVVGTQAFRDPGKMEEKIVQSLGFRVDIEQVSHPDRRVLVFTIPSRPRGTAYAYKGAYYMRSGEQLVPMIESQLRRIFDEGKPDWLEEYSLTGLDAAGVTELLNVKRFLNSSNFRIPATNSPLLSA